MRQLSIMADTGRFQELSTTKLQEILDNTVSEKIKKATRFGMKIFKVRIWEFYSKTINNCYVHCRHFDSFITA